MREVGLSKKPTPMRPTPWVLLLFVCVVALPRSSFAQDPQVGQQGGLIGCVEFFNSVAKGSQDVCIEVVPLRPRHKSPQAR